MEFKTPPVPEHFSEAEKSTWHLDGLDGSDRKFRHYKMSHLPPRISKAIASIYEKMYLKDGRQKANLYLLRISEYLTFKTVNLSTGDDSLKQYAKKMVSTCSSLRLLTTDNMTLYESLCRVVIKEDLTPPIVKGNVSLSGAIKRFLDESWWTRKARTYHARQFECGLISAGLVHKKSAIYVSDQTLKRRQNQKARTKRILDSLTATNEDDGSDFSLSELMEHSQANPTNRRNELMVRIAGCDQIAQDINHDGLFITITCPSRMHPVYAKSGDFNPLFDGSTPIQAQQYLSLVWQRIRAKLKRDQIHIYGIRVAEPQHDGTPHWHLLIFSDKKHTTAIKSACSHYALEDSPTEKGAQEHRVQYEMIDRTKGSAVGYIAKYISKNIDGAHIEKDLDGNDAKSSALRVEAWASTFGIRQFQMFGCPLVTIWRELRRLDGAPEGILQQAFDAADCGNWALFIDVLGGIEQEKKNLPVRLYRIWSDEEGKFGDPKGESILGVTDGISEVISRDQNWTISRKGNNVTALVRVEGAALHSY
jgi:hypothetical protein